MSCRASRGVQVDMQLVVQDPDVKANRARWSIELMRARKLFTTTWEYVLRGCRSPQTLGFG